LGWERKRVAIVEGSVIVQISQEYVVEQQKTEEREKDEAGREIAIR
jgi:hypothetical protein